MLKLQNHLCTIRPIKNHPEINTRIYPDHEIQNALPPLCFFMFIDCL